MKSQFTWNSPPWSHSSEYTGGGLLVGTENAAGLRLSVDSMITWKQVHSILDFK